MRGFQLRIYLVFGIFAVLGGLSPVPGPGAFLLTALGCIFFGMLAICLLAAEEEKRLLRDVVKVDREQAISNARHSAAERGWAIDQPRDVRLCFSDMPPGAGPSWEVQWNAAGRSQGRVWVDAVSGEVLGSDNNYLRCVT